MKKTLLFIIALMLFVPHAFAVDEAALKSQWTDTLESRQNQAQAAYDALSLRIDSMNAADALKKAITDCPSDKSKGVYLCEARNAVKDFTALTAKNELDPVLEGGNVVDFKPTANFTDKETAALEAIKNVSIALIAPLRPANVPSGDLVTDFIPALIRLFFRFAWLAVLISFLYSGTLMVITYDNEERISHAKSMLYYSLMGFAFVTLAFAIVKAVTNINFFGFV